jgi:hypothetical protein
MPRASSDELAPADGAAGLNGAAQHFGVEPKSRACAPPMPARHAQSFGGATRDTKSRDNRRQQEKTREHYGRGQRTVAFGQPDECDQEDEADGKHADYNGKERPNEKPRAEASLSLRL